MDSCGVIVGVGVEKFVNLHSLVVFFRRRCRGVGKFPMDLRSSFQVVSTVIVVVLHIEFFSDFVDLFADEVVELDGFFDFFN